MDDRMFMLIGFVVGLGPTFGLLWAIMSRFESRIAERDTNASFVMGIFAGLVVILGHLLFIVYYSFSSIGLVSAFGLALAECLLYFIYLNRRKLKKRPDKAFLGLGFALGTASMYIAFLMGQLFINIDFYWDHILGMIIYAVGASTVRGSMGILMSRSNERKGLLKNILVGGVILGFFNVATIVYLNPFEPFFWVFSLPCVLMGLGAFYYFMNDLENIKKWDGN
jgi:peptidoglycan biosynthesis protein MviN/MurJ (putative lipid II flippase)